MKPKKSTTNGDLPDSAKDKKQLKPEEATLDLPDVNDIPGQENVKVPPAGESENTTIASDDEEGVGLFEDGELEAAESNVSRAERKALDDAANRKPDSEDEDNLDDAQLDELDEDGEPLNVSADNSGSDLDVPGSEDDDGNEGIGEEDEENNHYSLRGEEEDENLDRD